MALVLIDRAQETATANTTVSFTLLGASTGYQTLAGVGNTNTTYYGATDGTNWEVGIGTYSTTGPTLTRTTILSSSNSGSAVTFSGTVTVWVDYAASKAVTTDTLAYPPAIGSTTPNTGAFTYISMSSSTSVTPTLSFNGSNAPYAAGATIAGSYLQHLLQNKSGTAGASTNYVLSNDIGTDSSYYGEFGINSSVYSAGTPADFFSLNNGIYFSGHDGDVTVGSGNGYKTYLAWGTTGDKAHVINASGALGLNTNITGTTNFGTSGQLMQSAGSAATPTWSSALSGLTIDNTVIGGTTPAASTFTTASLTGTTDQISAVAVTSDPSAPSAGNLKAFARTQAGYTTLAFENATNAVAPFQTMMPFRKISMWNAPGSQSATAPALFGFGALAALGTNTVTAPASTNMVTRTRRTNYVSSAVAGNFAGHHEAAGNIYLGSATSPAYSGFYFSVRFFIADTVASPRTFVGLSSITGTPTNVQPSTLTNCIGVGQGASDTNLFIYYGGSASQTPIDLGVNFPTNTANTDLYELNLFAPPTSNNTVYYQVRRLNTGDVASGTLTGTAGTVLPLNTTVIGYRAWRTNNATATAVNLAIVGVYCETDF